MTLPVSEICQQLFNSLRENPVVLLTAPPGAGKSTYLPLFLLKQPDFAQQRIILLEPRRLAAKSIATYLAAQLNEAVGQTVGYQIRFEQQVSKQTRLLVVTEGVLIRKIQQDPLLSATDLLIFDEFHERSLQTDLALALALEVQQLNEDLRILVMSATLAGTELREKLQAPLLASAGRSYPVSISYVAPTTEALWLQSAKLAKQLLDQKEGSFLVFLPGQREIEQAFQFLKNAVPANVNLYPLLGNLTLAEQQQAIAPAAQGYRKIVLATNIAETSLTIDGIAVVIDSGVARQSVYQPRLGFSKLQTIAISQAAATQRAGRAGRLSAGFCYRLDTPEKWERRRPFTVPEILQADLLNLRLEIAGWGCQVDDLFWLDPPPAAQLVVAEQCLRWLGALTDQGQLTPHGKAMLKLPTDPRLASMLLHAARLEQAGEKGATALAAWLTVLLEQTRRFEMVDIAQQLRLFQHQSDRSQVQQQVKQLLQMLGISPPAIGFELPQTLIPTLLSYAYVDRIAQLRGQGYLLANGTGAVLPPEDSLQSSEWLVVADLRLVGNQAIITTAAAWDLTSLQLQWHSQIVACRYVELEETTGRFIAQERQQLGALVLKRQTLVHTMNTEDRVQAWLDFLTKKGIGILDWHHKVQQLQYRIALAKRLQPKMQWPDWSQQQLQTSMDNWLAPALSKISSVTALRTIDLYPLLWQQLSYQQQQQLTALLPASWRSVLGTDIPLLYHEDDRVELSIRIQEMFGQSGTPVLAQGAIAVTVILLSPSKQPLQTTTDLASFWKNAYQEVKKEMKGRYPKHYWPDDPLQAQPTNKTKKAMLK